LHTIGRSRLVNPLEVRNGTFPCCYSLDDARLEA
jgi:hypothetical protein